MLNALLGNNGEVGKVASLYVLAVIFTGAAFVAGHDYLLNISIPPTISTILGAGLSFAIQTLGFHMAGQQMTQTLQQTKPPTLDKPTDG